MWLLSTCLLILYVSSTFAAADPSASAAGPSTETSVGTGAQDLQPLITKANGFLATGQFGEAVKAYSEAIEQSPIDYVLYYKRATAYYSLSKHQSALQDFDKVLDLTNSNFDRALLMKGRIHAKEGDWTNAKEMLKQYKSRVQSGKDATEAGDLLFEVSEGEVAGKKAKQSRKAGLYQACVEAATDALKTATHSVELRELRAECALDAGDVQQAVGDMIRVTHLTPPSTSHLLRIAQLSYFLLPPSTQAQSTLKQCLHFDPDSKPCAKLHRQLKAFDKSFSKLDKLKEANDWRGVISLVDTTKSSAKQPGLLTQFDVAFSEAATQLTLPAQIQPFKISDRRRILVHALCRAYTRTDQAKRGERYCEELLNFQGSESDVDGLVGKAESLMAQEMWEEAVRVFEKAWEASGRADHDVMQRLQKAQRLLKQSRQKDYYKVLGVARDADDKTIKRAYRKVAMKAHPDKGGSEDQMAAVNEAYEVLSNPELRARFDNGDDPMDPMAQQGGHPFQQGAGFGGNPFQQFFGGGGFHGSFGPDGRMHFTQQRGQGFHFRSGGM